MRKAVVGIVLGGLLLGTAGGEATAGDREWAVAGKVLTGLLVLDAVTSPRCSTTVVYQRPVYTPLPIVVHPPVVVRPPVYGRPPLVWRSPVRPILHRPVHPPVSWHGSGYGGGHRNSSRQGSRVGYLQSVHGSNRRGGRRR